MRNMKIAAILVVAGIGAALYSNENSNALNAATPEPGVDQNIFVNLSKKIVPSVVNISTYTTVKGQLLPGNPEDFLHKFFEDMLRKNGRRPPGGGDEDEGAPEERPRGGSRAMSLGTGFIIDASGLILTNNHVVAEADEIKISFTESADETPTDGEVVGRDPEIDVALIKVKSSREMTPIQFGDSDALQVGEYVIAVGNPFGQGHSVTHGIISAKGRLAPDFPLANYLQTDAPINPGNSGGPLVNLKGEVIGINNAIEQRAQGIGFAIPINLVKKILPQLRTKGTVARGFIGVLVHEITPEIAAKMGISKDLKATIVTEVITGQPAEKAGLKPYDVILEFNKKPIHTHAELITAVTEIPVGESVPMKILRSGKEQTLTIQVMQRPAEKQVSVRPKPEKEKKQRHIETGMTLEDLTPEMAKELGVPASTKGVVVESTAYGGAADKSGLLRGDVILDVDRKPVKNVQEFYNVVKTKKSYLLRVRRMDPQGNDGTLVIVLDLKE